MENIEIQRIEEAGAIATILRLEGPLTIKTLFDFQEIVRQPDLGNIIVDLAGVPYIDSAGLGAMLGHWAHTERAGHKFALAAANARVQVLFEITKIRAVLPVFVTVEQAEQSFVTPLTSSTAR